MNLKDIIRLITPPVLIPLAKKLRFNRKYRFEWEYVPDAWAYAQAHPEVKGWNVQDILEIYKEKWPQFERMVRGTGPLGVAHESELTTNTDINSHNATLAFGYCLALAAHEKDRLSVLDWGGGIGHYYLLAHALLPDVEIEYHCKDVPVLCEYGTLLFPQQHFYTDESCLDRTYNLVLASTSLHYTQDWQTLFQRLAGAATDYVYIANLPSVQRAPSFVFIQRPYQYGYNTEYLAWCLNVAEFLDKARCSGLDLIREFIYGYQPLIHGAPEQNIYRGYLFRVRSKGMT